MKIALCFIINYNHVLNKEHIWREWIEPNKDIINVYFYYKELDKIKSAWILDHTIPPKCIHETSYYHVIPAYLALMNYAFNKDIQNKWFCMLTDSCCPIISPKRFRHLFYNHHNNSLFAWKPAWWNPEIHKRGNLAKLPKELWLGHDPWFTLTRENFKQVMYFVRTQPAITNTICNGGLANETLFAVIFQLYKELDPNNSKSHIIRSSTHITDWSRPNSPTSPHVFKYADDQDIQFINKELNNNKTAMFIRKIDPEFPDTVLTRYIYEYNKELDDALELKEPFQMRYRRYGIVMKQWFNVSTLLFCAVTLCACLYNFWIIFIG